MPPPGRPQDADAFAAVVREHGDAVFGFVYRRVGDRPTAEDLSQEVFLRAWRARGGYRAEGSMRGWLCVIAANVVRDHARRLRRRPAEVLEAEFLDVPDTSDPAGRVAAAEALDQLRAALAALPPRHREMFLLRERDGLSYAEIAAALDCPIGTVMSGLSRARERLLRAVAR
jgi:RNA polymerase sigma-70 factor (ECF subfamily)